MKDMDLEASLIINQTATHILRMLTLCMCGHPNAPLSHLGWNISASGCTAPWVTEHSGLFEKASGDSWVELFGSIR